MALVTYPLNDVAYLAEDAELFHCTRSSGIHAGADFAYSVTGADNCVTIGTGIAWIRNSEFSGKVAALKASTTIDLGVADSTYPRIDSVVLQFSANRNDTDVVIKQGTAASAPVAPEVIRTEAVYELHLYQIRRAAGATAITAADITDLRLSSSYCGIMADSVTHVDTDAIYAQAMALIEQLQSDIDGVKDGSAYLMRSGGTMENDIDMDGFTLKNVANPVDDGDAVPKSYVMTMKVTTATLSASGWSSGSQTVSVEGVLADESKQAVITTAAAGSLETYLDANINCSGQGDGTLTFSCEDTPSAAITVNVLILTKGG